MSRFTARVWGFLFFTGALLAGNLAAQEAKILKIVGSGTATVTLPNGTKIAAKEGASIPVSAQIETDGAAELYIEAMPGAIATIKKNSRVTVETLAAGSAILALKQGNVVSQLDPARSAGRSYGVRTPKGVAASRGTVYTVAVNGENYTVVTGLGTVTITPTGGGASISVGPGGISMSTVNGGAVTTAAALQA